MTNIMKTLILKVIVRASMFLLASGVAFGMMVCTTNALIISVALMFVSVVCLSIAAVFEY